VEAVLVSLLFGAVCGALISSSQLTTCVDRGASDGISCRQKFVVAISLDGGQNDTESILYWSTAVTADGRSARLATPVTIKIRKSRPLVRYPVFYWQNVNAKPQESVIYTGTFGCDDSPSSSSPTCGRAFSPDTGSPIPLSEGYCCACSLCDFVGFCDGASRANTDCSLFGDGAAASCLSFSPLWYSAFSIGRAQTFFTITVTLSTPGEPDVELIVGPSVLGTADAAHGVAVRLVGDFAAFVQPLDLTDKYLLVPYGPVENPRVTAPAPTEWMLVDRSMVTQDGSECNKIGVSYNGFGGQGSRCSMHFGSCTANQIDDLRAKDLASAAAGKQGEYMVRNFGEFAVYDESMRLAVAERRSRLALEKRRNATSTDETKLGDVNGGLERPRHVFGPLEQQYYVAYLVDHVQASLVTLTLAADNVSFTVNLSPGKIVAANLSSFAASSRDGVLSLLILNTGSVTADYQVSVSRCTAGTFPVQAKVASLAPLQLQALTFNVFFEDLGGSADSACNVTLYDSQFAATDTVLVRFNTTATVITEGVQGGDRSPPGSDVLRQPDDANCAACPFYNPVCFIGKSCFWQMLVQLLSFLAVLGIIGLLLTHSNVVLGLCCSSGSSSETKTKEEHHHHHHHRRHRHSRHRDREPF
jgi:hypothetical protein